MRLALRLGIPAVTLGLTFVACAATGRTAASPAPATSGAAAKAAAVNIKGFAFAPATLNVDKGTKVMFSNQDSTTHTVTSGTNRTKDGTFDKELSGGTEDTITFDAAGTFEYFCRFHSSMKGTVVVK